MADLGNKSADDLRLYIERIERFMEEKKGIADDIKDVFAEAKAVGFDPKVMKIAIKQRAMDKSVRDEQRMLVDTYLEALGLL
jgi:uncharacterized protein (UPF0335 family)